MTLLPRPLQILDVLDVEAFCASVITRSGFELSYHEREDLLAHLISTTWELSTRFEPAEISFSSFAGTTLGLRIIDWKRQRNGRTRWVFKDHVYERPRPILVSLDGPERDRLETLVDGGGLESDPSGLAAELRDLQARGRRPGRRRSHLGGAAD